MGCEICNAVRNKVIQRQTEFPSVLAIANLVALEYYNDFVVRCHHELINKYPKKKDILQKICNFMDSEGWTKPSFQRWEGFYVTTFVSQKLKQVVIVHRGTEPTNINQLKADWIIFRNQISDDDITKAFRFTKDAIRNKCLKLEGRDFVRNDYSLTIAGHSLGGWLAQVCTLLGKHPELEPGCPQTENLYFGPAGLKLNLLMSFSAHCVVFDSPGALSVMDYLKRSENVDTVDESPCHELDVNVYLSNENLINTCGKHVGQVYSMDVLDNGGQRSSLPQTLKAHAMENILLYLRNSNNKCVKIDPSTRPSKASEGCTIN